MFLVLLSSGPDNLDNLRKLAEQFKQQVPGAGGDAKNAQEEDDDVPELVEGETFEAPTEENRSSQIDPFEREECCFYAVLYFLELLQTSFYDFDNS